MDAISNDITFVPDLGFTIFGTATYDNVNFLNGGLVSVLRVDDIFFMSFFK